MIDQFDEAFRNFIIQELNIKNNLIDISFDQPRREWSARLSRPTINVYLHDIRENSQRRNQQPSIRQIIDSNEATLNRQPLYLDLHYVVTVWTAETNDEHHILSRIAGILYRTGELPERYITEFFPEQVRGIPYRIAQYDNVINPRDLWSVLDNEMHPAVDFVATIEMNPYAPVNRPLVREVEISYEQLSVNRK